MSYIGMELDAFNLCPDVGDACGLTSAQVCHGLMRMWAYVFREEQEVVSPVQVRGFMYGSATASEALCSFGFLEAKEGQFRVKGSGRLLGLRQARRAGGLAARGNLIPGAFHRKKAAEGLADGSAEHLADEPHALAMGMPSALTTDNRQPTTDVEEEASAPPLVVQAGGWVEKVWRHHQAVFGGKGNVIPPIERDLIAARLADGRSADELCKAIDGVKANAWLVRKGLTKLARVMESDESVRVAMGWADNPPDAEPPKDVRTGVARAEDQDHSNQKVGADGTIDIAF